MLKKLTSLPTDKTDLVQRDFALLEAEEFLNVLLAQRLLLVTGAAAPLQLGSARHSLHPRHYLLRRQGAEEGEILTRSTK